MDNLLPLPEPDSYEFQHEETGQTRFVDSQQVEWGFEKNNPRLHKIGGAFTENQMRAYALANLAAAQQEIARLRAALDEIGGLSRHLRNGGPDESDLEELSDGLENAVRIAVGALEQTK